MAALKTSRTASQLWLHIREFQKLPMPEPDPSPTSRSDWGAWVLTFFFFKAPDDTDVQPELGMTALDC